ncbi:MAG TPA: hypothetical protein VE267_12645 [Bradyrhizobium sp.]|nr:hypothetical protein [Bradyrhizobium sp.]
MHWITKCARTLLLLVPVLAFATPTFAQDTPVGRDPRLSDSQEPGSVIVFPKFVRGTQTLDGVVVPSTEIEVAVVCPIGAVCPEHQPVKIRFHWVCPGLQDFNTKLICRENNFDVFATVNGKVVFNTENMTITGSNAVNVAQPPCGMGYLIGWVVNTSDQPIKYDGLIGDAVIRETSTAVSAYNAIPIQAANDAAATGTRIATVADPLTGLPRLAFDGLNDHYKAVTGVVIGDVKFNNRPAAAGFPIASDDYLILLTLDVRSDFSNFPTEVNVNFWNESSALSPNSPLFEKLLSTSLEFVCWAQFRLTDIDPNLTQAQMGTRKGVFRSSLANKFPFAGIFDTAGPVTLLGLVETLEGPASAPASRTYFSAVYNDSAPVPTFFLPE